MSALLFSAAAICASRLSAVAAGGLAGVGADFGCAVTALATNRLASAALIIVIRMGNFLSSGKFERGHQPIVVLCVDRCRNSRRGIEGVAVAAESRRPVAVFLRELPG